MTLCSSVSLEAQRPQWRGPGGLGISSEKNLPTEWSPAADGKPAVNIKWRTEIPGRGHSSPIVAGNLIFVTTSVKGVEVPGRKAHEHLKFDYTPGYIHPDAVDIEFKHALEVFALDAGTGKVVWERTAWSCRPIRSASRSTPRRRSPMARSIFEATSTCSPSANSHEADTMRPFIALAAALLLAQAPPLTKAEQLQDAARKGDAAAVKTLLDEGVDVNTKFRYNATALFYACDHGHLEVVKVLLDRGADMTVKDTFYGFTPLMLATGPAQKKTPAHSEIARLLIQKGAPGKEGALGSAIQDGDMALVKVVLDSGLPAGSLTDALEAAKTANKPDIVALLEKAGAKPYDDFKIDPAMLAKFPGTYKGTSGNELTLVAAGARLTLGQAAAPPGQRLTLVATGDKAFKAIGAPMAITFQVEGDKVAGFTLTQGANPGAVYTRVEGK